MKYANRSFPRLASLARMAAMLAAGVVMFLLFPMLPARASGFQTHVDYVTGVDPASVAVGDFNGDGQLDLVTGDYDDDTESVFLGNGDGTFLPRVFFPTGSCPLSLTVADVNADGKMDLIVTDHDANTVSVLLGNGDGTFQPNVTYPTGVTPVSVVVADFNGDGKLDMATSNATDKTVSVLLGNGDGTFQAHVDYPTGAKVLGVALGDFNGDGKTDLVTSNYNTNTVGILLGNGDGTFQPHVDYPTGNRPNSVTVVDLNKDGKADLVMANYDNTSHTISILLGSGDGSFPTHVEYVTGPTPKGPYSATPGDFNGDGKLDLVTANGNGNTVSVFMGNGDGTFQTNVDYTLVGAAKAVSVSDFNQDGAPDLAVPNGAHSLSILLNTGGTFVSTTSSLNPSQVGQAVTFTMTVTASLQGVGAPTGRVAFRDGATVLGFATLSNGQASFTTSALTVGTHRIGTRYAGDGNFNPHIAPVVVQKVTP